jgi:hypothetical protein
MRGIFFIAQSYQAFRRYRSIPAPPLANIDRHASLGLYCDKSKETLPDKHSNWSCGSCFATLAFALNAILVSSNPGRRGVNHGHGACSR